MGRRNTGSITFLTSRGKWQVRVTDPITQKRRSVTVDTEREAREILEAARERIQALPKTLRGMTLSRYVTRWLEEHADDYAPKTWRSTVGRLEKHVLPHPIAKLEMKELTPPHFHRLINRELKAKKLSWNTRRNIRADLSAVLKAAVKDGHLPSNPMRDVDVEGKRQTAYYKFTAEDLALLLHDPRIPKARQLRYKITFYLGQRSGDIWAIKLQDVDLEAQRVRIWCSKQQAQITYPLLPPAVEAIQEWLRHLARYRNNPDKLLFPSKTTGKQRKETSSNPIKQLRKDCRMLGIKAAPNTKIAWHSWRGSLATHLQSGALGQRWTAQEAARQLGHKSVQTTLKHYTEHEYVYPVEHMAQKASGVSAPALRVIQGGRIDHRTGPAAPSEKATIGNKGRR